MIGRALGMMIERCGAVLLLVAAIGCGGDAVAVDRLRVIDGDTIEICPDAGRCGRVRLAGIDAPERAQAFGEMARLELQRSCVVARVRVEERGLDRWGRSVGRVFCEDRDVERELLSAGLAWHFKRYQRTQPVEERVADANAETEARRDRRGLWAVGDPESPWDFRKRKADERTRGRP